MRIFAAGDIHGDISLSRKLANKAVENSADLVVLCGDLTNMEKSTDYIIGPFKEAGKKVLIIPGNHESEATADFLAELYDIKNLHGYSTRYGETGFFGCSGVNLGLHKMPEEEIFTNFSDAHEGISYLDKKVMVSHVHPTGSRMEQLSDFVKGSHGVRKAAEEFSPDLLLCSHVHEAEGIEEKIGSTSVVNVGRQGRILDL
ncbi:MAG: metallophosphoesterase family protein [Nanobdellota archaeon]